MNKIVFLITCLIVATGCGEDKPGTESSHSAVFMSTNDFFTGYAQALLSYSPEKISSFYQVPLTVYSDQGIQQVSKPGEVEAFWKQGVKPYESLGIRKSVPQIVSEDRLSEKIIMCKVLWKNYAASGKEVARETNFYILSKTSDGMKISGLIIMVQQ